MKSYQQVFKRTEKKYLVTAGQYRDLERELAGLTVPDRYGRTEILNIYYDTPDFRLIRRSLDKPKYKEKLRLRTYGTPSSGSTAFIELKKKYQGVVYKRRADMPYRDALRFLDTGVHLRPLGRIPGGDPESLTGTAGNEEQILREIAYFMDLYPDIGPAMVIAYDRTAVNWAEDGTVRITFDADIRYRQDRLDLRCGSQGDLLLPPGTRLLELKINGSMPVRLSRILSELEIFPVSVSKYGRAYETEVLTGRLAAGNEALQAVHTGYPHAAMPAGNLKTERSMKSWIPSYSIQ